MASTYLTDEAYRRQFVEVATKIAKQNTEETVGSMARFRYSRNPGDMTPTMQEYFQEAAASGFLFDENGQQIWSFEAPKDEQDHGYYLRCDDTVYPINTDQMKNNRSERQMTYDELRPLSPFEPRPVFVVTEPPAPEVPQKPEKPHISLFDFIKNAFLRFFSGGRKCVDSMKDYYEELARYEKGQARLEARDKQKKMSEDYEINKQKAKEYWEEYERKQKEEREVELRQEIQERKRNRKIALLPDEMRRQRELAEMKPADPQKDEKGLNETQLNRFKKVFGWIGEACKPRMEGVAPNFFPSRGKVLPKNDVGCGALQDAMLVMYKNVQQGEIRPEVLMETCDMLAVTFTGGNGPDPNQLASGAKGLSGDRLANIFLQLHENNEIGVPMDLVETMRLAKEEQLKTDEQAIMP